MSFTAHEIRHQFSAVTLALTSLALDLFKFWEISGPCSGSAT